MTNNRVASNGGGILYLHQSELVYNQRRFTKIMSNHATGSRDRGSMQLAHLSRLLQKCSSPMSLVRDQPALNFIETQQLMEVDCP